MSAGPAFVVLARSVASGDSGDANLGAFGPYRSEARAKQVHRALQRATRGAPEPVELVLLVMVPGALTAPQAVEHIWEQVWEEDWEAGSTSGEALTATEIADEAAREAQATLDQEEEL